MSQVAEGAPPRLCHGHALYKHYYNNGIILSSLSKMNAGSPYYQLDINWLKVPAHFLWWQACCEVETDSVYVRLVDS